ncbi:MAG: S9 family peptidase, partial [Acidobacteria bacterium]|nr:S9 family peptidase [Acidobacteriota bacterium]
MRRSSRMTVLLCLVLTAFAPGAAPAQADRLTVQDVFNFELAVDPQIAPDGGSIVYVRQFADIMGDRRHSNLWVIRFDGTGHRPLTSGNYNDTSPRWSSDGKEIVFISNRGGSPQVYRLWMDTGRTASLTNLTSPPSGLALSPDGKWISFTMHVPENQPQIAKMPAAPEGAKWAEPAKVIDRLVYRFNGFGYLKPGYIHLFVLPAEGGTPRQLSKGALQHGAPFGAGDPVWTPDSKHILMSVNRNENFELEPRDTDIYEFSAADGSVRKLTNNKGPDGDPAVSPDGRLIAYTGYEDRYQGYQVQELRVMNRDGSGSRSISGGMDRDVNRPQWAADGSGIYFLSDDKGNTGLYFISLDGKSRKLIGNVGSSGSAYSGGGAFTMARNGAFAVTWKTTQVPGDIAVGMLSDPKPRVITAVNEDLFAGRK